MHEVVRRFTLFSYMVFSLLVLAYTSSLSLVKIFIFISSFREPLGLRYLSGIVNVYGVVPFLSMIIATPTPPPSSAAFTRLGILQIKVKISTKTSRSEFFMFKEFKLENSQNPGKYYELWSI